MPECSVNTVVGTLDKLNVVPPEVSPELLAQKLQPEGGLDGGGVADVPLIIMRRAVTATTSPFIVEQRGNGMGYLLALLNGDARCIGVESIICSQNLRRVNKAG